MANGSTVNELLLRASSTDSTLSGSTSTTKKTDKKDDVSKNEFLNLLVTQLKNQDPLDPMKDDQFAVNLAQFSQLEQLVSINEKVGTQGSGDINSLAGYLGQQVTLDSDVASVTDHDGGLIKFALPSDMADVKIDLLESDGSVKESISLGAKSGGKHVIDLQNLQTASGSYQVQVVGKQASGGEVPVKVQTAGVVSGFIPGPEPKLIVEGAEVDPSEVLEVNLPQ